MEDTASFRRTAGLDFTGGLQAARGAYVNPTVFVTDEGVTRFTGAAVTVQVTEHGTFEPANISVPLGCTISWELATFESVHLRSAAAEATMTRRSINASLPDEAVTVAYSEGNLFDSGTINRLTNPSGVFSHTFEQGEGTFGVGLTVVGLRRRLVDVAAQGSVKVEQAACGSFDSCLTCLILPHCIWCSGNQTCLGRNESTNMPKDADVVIEAMPAAAGSGRKFEHLKYYAPEGGFRNYGLTW